MTDPFGMATFSPVSTGAEQAPEQPGNDFADIQVTSQVSNHCCFRSFCLSVHVCFFSLQTLTFLQHPCNF